jgi:carboxymethylenebutenolidase
MRYPTTLLAALLLAGCTRPPAPPANATAENVHFPSGKDSVPGFLARPAGAGPFPAVVVVHTAFGLTDGERDVARRLADGGYVALAPDLYRGEKVRDEEEAHILDRGLPRERALGDLKAAVDFLSAREDVRAGSVGIFGWAEGGGYALDSAVADPRLRAAVLCYGQVPAEASSLKGLRAPVLAVFAGKDEGITSKEIDDFRSAMRKAGKRLEGPYVYAGRDRGFLKPVPAPDDKDSSDAWKHIDSFLAAELKGE